MRCTGLLPHLAGKSHFVQQEQLKGLGNMIDNLDSFGNTIKCLKDTDKKYMLKFTIPYLKKV